MAIVFREIKEALRLLRATFADDLEPLIDSGPGGSYAVAALVAVGHEELSRLWRGAPRGELTFAETLPTNWRPIAPSLYGALRDGLAHGYGTQTIIYAGGHIDLGLSTGPRASPHRITVGPFGEDGAETNILLLNTRRLVTDLRKAFDRFEEELRHDASLRAAFGERGMKGRQRHVQNPEEARAWSELTSRRQRHP